MYPKPAKRIIPKDDRTDRQTDTRSIIEYIRSGILRDKTMANKFMYNQSKFNKSY